MAPPTAAGGAAATIRSTAISVIANLVGAGLLSLPYTFHRAGFVPGLIAMIVICVLNALSMMLLARCCELSGLSGGFTYLNVATRALGPVAARFITATMIFYTLGSCVSFVVLIGDFLPDLICEQGCDTHPVQNIFGERHVIVVIVASCILYPLALARSLNALRFTSTLSFVCILYTTIMILAKVGSGPRASAGDLNMSGGGFGIFVAFPILAVSFSLHYNVPKFFSELSARTLARFGVVTAASFAGVLVLYIACAAGGYLLFGEQVQQDVLSNFARDDAAAIVARVALSVIVMGCYPLAFNSLRIAVVSALPVAWAEAINAPAAAAAAAAAAVPLPAAAAALDGAASHKTSPPTSFSTGSGRGGGDDATCTGSMHRALLGADYEATGDAGAAAAAVLAINTPAASGGGDARLRKGAASPGGGYAVGNEALAPEAGHASVGVASSRSTITSAVSGCCTRFWASARRDWRHALLTKVLVLVSVGVGLGVPQIGTVLTYKGALGASLLVYIFPAWFYFALVQRKLHAAHAAGGGASASASVGASRVSISGVQLMGVAQQLQAGGDEDDADSQSAASVSDAAALLGASPAAAGGAGGGAQPVGPFLWSWSDLVTTRHGLLATVATCGGAIMMIFGVLAATQVIG